MIKELFGEMLIGGRPNSLGRTVDVVGIVFADRAQLEELYACYQSEDAMVGWCRSWNVCSKTAVNPPPNPSRI